MAHNRELLTSLLAGFKSLRFRDEDGLTTLHNRGRMLIRVIFGEDSDYYKRFIRTSWYPVVHPTSHELDVQFWTAAQRQVVSLINTMLEELSLNTSGARDAEENTAVRSNDIFVVHGHDNEMKQAVARTVEKLGLGAVILHEKPNRGQTLIEKIERFSTVGFAVVLLSPDDIGYSQTKGPDTAKPRARQNVILELGYFAAKLGRENVVALYKGEIELPSDYDGVLYTRYDGDSGAWRSELVAELKESGYDVSADNLYR